MTAKKPSNEERLDIIEAHLGLHDTNKDPVADKTDDAVEPEAETATRADAA